MQKQVSAIVRPVIYYSASVLLLLAYAWFNHYPIVYSDTGTYLGSGFMPYSPHDRPFTYGIFLRLASLNGFSLWTVIIAQALLLSYLLHGCVQLFLQRKSEVNRADEYLPAFLLLIWVTVLSGISFPVSQLMADVFTPIAALTLLQLLLGAQGTMKRIFLMALFFGSIATHNSHFMMFLLLIMLIMVLAKLMRWNFITGKKILITLSLTLIAWMPMSKSMRESSHVFLMGAMCEHGILKTWLDDNCDKNNYFICSYKDSLPTYAWQFVWMDYSPLNRQGWDASRDDYRAIIRQTLTTPKYIGMHVQASVKATADQLTSFDIGDGTGVFDAESNLGKVVNEYFPKQMPAYLQSRQNQGRYEFIHPMNRFYRKAMVLCVVLFFLGWYFQRRKLTGMQHAILLMLILAVALNAWSCGTFANAIPRLGLKMMWLFQLGSGLLLLQWASDKFPRVKK